MPEVLALAALAGVPVVVVLLPFCGVEGPCFVAALLLATSVVVEGPAPPCEWGETSRLTAFCLLLSPKELVRPPAPEVAFGGVVIAGPVLEVFVLAPDFAGTTFSLAIAAVAADFAGSLADALRPDVLKPDGSRPDVTPLFVPLDVAEAPAPPPTRPAAPPPTRPAAPPPTRLETPVVVAPLVAPDVAPIVGARLDCAVMAAEVLAGAITVRDFTAESSAAEMGSSANADSAVRGSSVGAVEVIAGALLPTAEIGSRSNTPREVDLAASLEEVMGDALVADDAGTAAVVVELWTPPPRATAPAPSPAPPIAPAVPASKEGDAPVAEVEAGIVPAPKTRAAISVAGALVLLDGSSGAARGLLDAVEVAGCAMKPEPEDVPVNTERSTAFVWFEPELAAIAPVAPLVL